MSEKSEKLEKMIFVGRSREMNKIIRLIERNNNVIVTGKYGIGKTKLVKHTAEINSNRYRFIFIDFSQPPAKACQNILFQLLTKKQFVDRKNKTYKSNRFLCANLKTEENKQLVIVLDNIAKLSHPKLALIRTLSWEKRFRFVAIVENFLPEKDLNLLRLELFPTQIITLQHFNLPSTARLLRHFSEKYHFNWDDRQIKVFASITQGYPLGIMSLVTRKLMDRKP